ncbi:MAG: dockerin type I repeat-containing protein [Clostridia bacterium]|nr:dockerin type I repeat-containing protein [Clostridia bacterium]
MKKVTKRFLKMLLAACMLFTAIPLGVGAAADTEWFTEKDVQGIKSTIISNKYHALYVDVMMRYHLLSETNNHRVERNLNDGKSIVFFFDGCSDNVDDSKYSDINKYRLSSYCAVIQLKDGVPTIVYESEFNSTIPDNPRNPETNEGDPVPTVLDGIYNIQSTNHGGSYAALWIEDDGTQVPVMRCTETTNYVSTSKYINIHARYPWTGAPLDGITSDSYSSSGCFNVGKTSDSFRDYNKFIELILGVKNARKPDWNNAKCTSGVDHGLVIVDRSHYQTQLAQIYKGNVNNGAEIVAKLVENSLKLQKEIFNGLGDVNGNGEIDKYDYITVKRGLLGTLDLTDVQTMSADVNKNGETEKFDYILIKRDILGTYEIKD